METSLAISDAAIPDAAIPDVALRARNLAAFAARFPALHERLTAIRQPHSRLIRRPEGGWDIALGDTHFYGRDAAVEARAQIAAFRAHPVRRYLTEPDPEALNGLAGMFCRRWAAELAARGEKTNRVPDRGYFTLVFGIGLAMHLAALPAVTGARHLILIEPNIENLYHSLDVTDWDALFRAGDRDGHAYSLIVENRTDAILARVRKTIRQSGPALVDGTAFMTHYRNSMLRRVMRSLYENFVLLIVGLGTLEDEFRMTANAVGNISRQPARILADPLPERPEPLLIVGSGPSVDRSIGDIRRLAGSAALMSIGTGLKVLLRHGIRPDFHVEVENNLENAEILQPAADTHGLDGILLIAAISVHPRLREMFGDSVLFFRERSSATMLFAAGRTPIQPSGPTVANAGLAVGERLGFREIWLFGTDMGRRAGGAWHSRYSAWGDGQLVEPRTVTGFRLAGNFGGTVETGSVLFWSRHMLENFLRLHPHVRCGNCSDGARIAGATPKLARLVAPAGPPPDRAALRASILRRLPVMNRDWLCHHWNLADFGARLDALTAQLEAIRARAVAQADPGLDWIGEMTGHIAYETDTDPAVNACFFGSLSLLFAALCWYDARVSPAARPGLRRRALELVGDCLAHAALAVRHLEAQANDHVTADRPLAPIPVPRNRDHHIPGLQGPLAGWENGRCPTPCP